MVKTPFRQLAPLLLLVAGFSQSVAYAQTDSNQMQVNGTESSGSGTDISENGGSFNVVTTVNVAPYVVLPQNFAAMFVENQRDPNKPAPKLQTNIGHPLNALAYFSPFANVPAEAQASTSPASVDRIMGAAVNLYFLEAKPVGLTIKRTAGKEPASSPALVVAVTSN